MKVAVPTGLVIQGTYHSAFQQFRAERVYNSTQFLLSDNGGSMGRSTCKRIT